MPEYVISFLVLQCVPVGQDFVILNEITSFLVLQMCPCGTGLSYPERNYLLSSAANASLWDRT